MRSLVAGFLIVVIGVAGLAWVTDGFRAVLLETARRLSINAEHPEFPHVLVEDQLGIRLSTADLRGRTIVATFMYSRCATLCTVTGTDIAWLQHSMPAASQSQSSPTVQWLSISFDERDDRAALQDYAERHRARWPDWLVVRIPDAADRRRFLRALGVVAIPDGFGGFTHNAALYLVGPDGRVRSVFDIDAAPAVLAALTAKP
ncbi:MAG: SCO family protein [Pseudomonadales bacterium]|nr:SCO family protein [Pseudomonadales bacterium]